MRQLRSIVVVMLLALSVPGWCGNIVDSLRAECKKDFFPLICRSVEQSLTNLTKGMLPSDEAEIKKLYQGICAAQLPMNELKTIIGKRVHEALIAENRQRKSNQIKAFKYVIRRNPVACPLEDLKAIEILQKSIDWLSLGIDHNVPVKEGTAMNLLQGKSFLSDEQVNKNDNTRRVGPYLNRVATHTAFNITKSVYLSVDQVFDELKKK